MYHKSTHLNDKVVSNKYIFHLQNYKQEQHYDDLLKKEKEEHQKTRDELEKLKSTLGDKDKAVEALRKEYEQKMADLNKMVRSIEFDVMALS